MYACNSLVHVLYSYFDSDSKACQQLERTKGWGKFRTLDTCIVSFPLLLYTTQGKIVCRSKFYSSGSGRPSTSFKLRMKIFFRTKVMSEEMKSTLDRATLLCNIVEKKNKGDYATLHCMVAKCVAQQM